MFLGAAITATSVGITARVLKDMGASRSGEAKIILGAAVVDDVLALVVLGAVTAWVGAGQGAALLARTVIVALVMKTVGFLVLAIVLGMRLTPTWFRQAARLRTGGALLAVGLCFCFFLSWAASAIGLAALVGAFAAGLVLEDTHSEIFVQRGERPLGELLQPMTSFLVPVFFVLVGFRTNLAALGHAGVAGVRGCAQCRRRGGKAVVRDWRPEPRRQPADRRRRHDPARRGHARVCGVGKRAPVRAGTASRRTRLHGARDGGDRDDARDASGAQVEQRAPGRITRRHETGSVSRIVVPAPKRDPCRCGRRCGRRGRPRPPESSTTPVPRAADRARH